MSADVVVVVDIAGGRHREVAELVGQCLGSIAVTVEDRHADLALDQSADRRRNADRVGQRARFECRVPRACSADPALRS